MRHSASYSQYETGPQRLRPNTASGKSLRAPIHPFEAFFAEKAVVERFETPASSANFVGDTTLRLSRTGDGFILNWVTAVFLMAIATTVIGFCGYSGALIDLARMLALALVFLLGVSFVFALLATIRASRGPVHKT